MSGTITKVPASQRGQRRLERFLCLSLEAEAPWALGETTRITGFDEAEIGRGASRRFEAQGKKLRIEVADGRMSTRHARLSRLAGKWAIEDLGSKNGLLVNGEPVTKGYLTDGDLIEVGHTFFYFGETEATIISGRTLGVATLSPSFACELARLASIAETQLPILLLGESGTGKEVCARAIHESSKRAGRFVAVNSAAIPAALIESELFGNAKGAFTGAVSDRPGLISAADRGTLFLDEIADLPSTAQAALLRVLETQEVTPVGGTDARRVEFRVVAATHKDLRQLVDAGSFRQDLYARLAGHTVLLPPLRERREDIGALISVLLGRNSARVTIDIEAVRALFEHTWPLNARELSHALARALAFCGEGPITIAHLPELATSAAAAPVPLDASEASYRDQIRALEVQLIVAALDRAKGSQTDAAKALNIPLRTLVHKLKQLGIRKSWRE